MTRRYVNQLVNGDSVDEAFLVADKQLRANRQGNLYLHLELRDKTGTVGARLWNATENLARLFEPGDFLRVRGKTQVFQGSLQIILNHFDVVDPSQVEPDEFLPQSAQNVGKLMARLRELLLAMNNPQLRALVECFLMDDEFVARFTTAPAGIKNHHAYQGGLIEHVVALLNVADRISDLYPEIDRDLLLTGIFLHDVGKVEELTYDRAFAYSDSGQLVGHLVIGVEMLRDKAKQFEKLMGEPFPAELLLRLKHMIVSHHGSYEFGSPKLPMTLEAVALHYLDNLDAKIHTFSREIREDPSRDSSWTPFQQSLGRRLFKGTVQSDIADGEDGAPA
jgi:3'-5' exoribonuclease